LNGGIDYQTNVRGASSSGVLNFSTTKKSTLVYSKLSDFGFDDVIPDI